MSEYEPREVYCQQNFSNGGILLKACIESVPVFIDNVCFERGCLKRLLYILLFACDLFIMADLQRIVVMWQSFLKRKELKLAAKR